MSSLENRSSQVDVLYLITGGFPFRMINSSGLLNQLIREGISVGLAFSHYALSNFDMEALRHIPHWIVPPLKRSNSPLFTYAMPYLFENVRKNPALSIKHLRNIKESSLRRKVYFQILFGVNYISCHSSLVRKALKEVSNFYLNEPLVKDLLSQIRPKLVISTYPSSYFEAAFLKVARTLNIPSIVQLLSWDNITSKGYFLALPDYFLSWGPIMTQEIQEYYKFPRDRIFETGPAHFDRHVNGVNEELLKKKLKSLGVNESHPYILLGMTNARTSPYEYEIVKWLADRINKNCYGEKMQLIIRLHPQMFTEQQFEHIYQQLKSVCNDRVFINKPELIINNGRWNFKDDDLDILVNLIKGSSLVINSGSTIALDAMALDKPVIFTMFDGSHNLPIYHSVKRFENYIHLSKLFSLNGGIVVHDYESFDRAIRNYLLDPNTDREERKRAVEMELGEIDGGISKRISLCIVKILSRSMKIYEYQFVG